MKSNEKVVIGWIDGGQIMGGFAAYLAQILLHRSDRIEAVIAASSPYLSDNRNSLVRTFLDQTDAEWLVSLDTDICVELESFDELLNAADKDKHPIVGGMYFLPMSTGIQVSASCWDLNNPGKYEWLADFVKEVNTEGLHAIGLGYAVIHRSIFEKVAAQYPDNPKPWFQDEYRPLLENWVSDDINFFDKVHALDEDINVTLCTKATSAHLKYFRLTEDAFIHKKYDEPHVHDFGSHKKISWWAKGKGHKK
jgi:hypothetical protein